MSRKKVDMYEELLPDGRCKYRLPYLDPLSHKKKTVSVIMEKQSASNYKLAKRFLEDKVDGIMLEKECKDITLAALVDQYLEEKQSIIRPSTYQRDKFTLDKMVSWLGSDTLLSSLSVPLIKQTIKKHTEKNVTYNEYIRRFKPLLNWSYINGYLEDRTIIDRLQMLPDNKKKRIEDKYLEKEELELFLDSVDHELWRYVTEFLVLSGLRIGELIVLRDSDIDDKYIHIDKTYEISVKMVSDSAKTYDSNREVYLSPELKKCIKNIRKYMREFKFRHGIRSDLFICSESGSYFNYDSYRMWLGENSDHILEKHITPHALRHTTASLLFADGVPLDVVSRMLGHKDSQITREIYLHVTEALKSRDNNILEKAAIL